MSLTTLAALLVLAVSIGWYLRGSVREPPEGTDPDFWARAVREWRAKR